MKIFPSTQEPLIERDPEPRYFAHIYLPGEILYFSDRNFKFNGYDYEAYLLDIPQMLHSIERLGGYLNLNSGMTFRNGKFRDYEKLFDFFLANPITKKEMDLFVLYLFNGIIPESDDSTKLYRLSFGEPKRIGSDVFDFELSSILFSLDSRKLFTQINRGNWPNAAPQAIGQMENLWIGELKRAPCHCVETGAASTLFEGLTKGGTEVYLSDVDWPIPFPNSGTIQINEEKMSYTGKNSTQRKLTGLTRGLGSTLSAVHKPGAVVWLVQTSYKYLIANKPVKSVSNIYVSQTRAPSSDYTISLNDNGKSIASFTKKALNKHGHGEKSVFEMHPISASHQDIEGSIYWMGPDSAMKDLDENTWQRWAYTGVIPEAKTGDMILNFGAYQGDVPDAVYVCITIYCQYTSINGEYTRLQTPEVINIGQTGKTTKRLKLSSTTVPSQVRIRGHTNLVPSGGYYEINCYEVWLEIERYSTNPSGSADEVLAPVVTADGQGCPDDPSGTYTGSPNALIENPSDVMRYLLVGLLGRSMAEIDSSFETVRTTMANRITGGYKVSAILSRLGNSPMEISKSFQEQTRSQMREDGGKFFLSFDPDPIMSKGLVDILPPDGTGITASSETAGHEAVKSCDDNLGTSWWAANVTFPQYVQVDWGTGSSRNAWTLTIKPVYGDDSTVKDFVLQGSDDGIIFFDIYSGRHGNNSAEETFGINDVAKYRFHRLVVLSAWGGLRAAVVEWELWEITVTLTPPTSVVDIDSKIFIGDPVFNMTSATEIKNLIRGVFDLDYGGQGNRRKFGDYLQQVELKDSKSIGKYGELPEDLALPAITNADMAEDICWWHLWNKKDCNPLVDLRCNRLIRKLERGDHFTLKGIAVSAWDESLWRVLEMNEIPENQEFRIRGIKYIS